MYIKKWFLEKNFTDTKSTAIKHALVKKDVSIVGESVKAYHFIAYTTYGNIDFWCPKSCVMSEEEYVKEVMASNGGINIGV